LIIDDIVVDSTFATDFKGSQTFDTIFHRGEVYEILQTVLGESSRRACINDDIYTVSVKGARTNIVVANKSANGCRIAH
jgi:hypothetical protein